MYIRKNIMDTEGFTLDSANIDTTSTSKARIRLPYHGPLPADLNDTTNASIAITLRVGLTVDLVLIVERAGKRLRYPISATAEEIDKILYRFFFTADGQTRPDTGLDRYALGLNQSSYVNWKRLTLDENGLDNLLFQLSPASIERVLQHIKHSETA